MFFVNGLFCHGVTKKGIRKTLSSCPFRSRSIQATIFREKLKTKMELPPDFHMKSGVGDGSGPADPELMLAMSSVLVVFMEKAVDDAAEYTRAAGRTVVSARDVQLAMKAQAVPSSHFWEAPDLAERFATHRTALLDDMARESEEEDSSEEEEEGEEGEEQEEDVAAEAWTPARPEGASTDEIAALVRRMNSAEAEFSAWRPVEPLELAVRNALVKTGT